jgi:Photosynthetic reaction centre cytochrome C subunit
MNSKTAALALVLVLVLGCTTGQATAPAATATQPASEFKNLQVLPRTLTRPELMAVMRTFTRGLGVRCNHCHVATETTPEEKLDFASDAKEEKRVARVMIQMANQINGPFMDRVEAAEGHEANPAASAVAPGQGRVWCWTCHRGKVEPEMPPPPPQPAPAPGA